MNEKDYTPEPTDLSRKAVEVHLHEQHTAPGDDRGDIDKVQTREGNKVSGDDRRKPEEEKTHEEQEIFADEGRKGVKLGTQEGIVNLSSESQKVEEVKTREENGQRKLEGNEPLKRRILGTIKRKLVEESPGPDEADVSKRKKNSKEGVYTNVWSRIKSVDDLKQIDNLISVESRLTPRRTKSATPQWPVSGSMVAEWIGPPSNMPFLVLQEALRIGNSSPLLPEVKRVYHLVREEYNSHLDKSPFMSFFSKLHPEEVRHLATSLKMAAIKAVPDSTIRALSGVFQEETTPGAIDETVRIIETVIHELEGTQLDELTHGGMEVIKASWHVIKSMLSCDDC